MTSEITMKQWRFEEAVRQGVSEGAIASRYYHLHLYPRLRIRRVNKRVVFVVGKQEPPLPVRPTGAAGHKHRRIAA